MESRHHLPHYTKAIRTSSKSVCVTALFLSFIVMLFIAILVAGAMLANCSYTGILVRHSQSSVHIPSCPSGYTRLWDGYSFMGSAAIRGNGNGQDLSSPGSCLKNFRTIAAAQCYGSSLCEHYQTGDFSVWLWGRDHLQASHCVVCEGPYTHIAVHSQTASYPSRPSGWRSAWSGYSFVEVNLHGLGSLLSIIG